MESALASRSPSIFQAQRGNARADRFGPGKTKCAEFCAFANRLEYAVLFSSPWARHSRSARTQRQNSFWHHLEASEGAARRISPEESSERFPTGRNKSPQQIYRFCPCNSGALVTKRAPAGQTRVACSAGRDFRSSKSHAKPQP